MKDLKDESGKMKQTFEPKEILDGLLTNLNERQQNVLNLRFGLKHDHPYSLSAIGKEMDITRERVRQIEVDSFCKLKKISKKEEYKRLVNNVMKIIESFGGVCEKGKLKEMLLGKDITDLQRRQMMLTLNASSKLFFQKSNQNTNAYWYIDEKINKKELEAAILRLVNFVKNENNPVDFSQIDKFALIDKKTKIEDSGIKKIKLRMLLILARQLERNILEHWGMRNWGLISGKGSREKAYLVLKKRQQPLHFRTLTDQINKYWIKKVSLPQTVHNELIKDDKFVQVGKGIYGLSEWGILKGTVKDVIMKLLRDNTTGLTRDEIIGYVLNEKQVKKTTVLINLTNKDIFVRGDDGKYYLK